MRPLDKSQIRRPAALDPTSHTVIAEFNHNHDVAEKLVTSKNLETDKKKPKYRFKRYSHDDVKISLEDLSYGKCAYCESVFAKTQPVEVEHFRPKGKIAEAPDLPGYWWLAADWDNLLPSCIDCNRSRRQIAPTAKDLRMLLSGASTSTIFPRHSVGKGSSFPLLDGSKRADGPDGTTRIEDEKPALINPAAAGYKFEDFFRYGFEKRQTLGVLVLPTDTEMGAGNEEELEKELEIRRHRAMQTILVCGLNRLPLRQARQRALIEVDFLLKLFTRQTRLIMKWTEISAEDKRELEGQRQIVSQALKFKCHPKGEFSHMIQAYLRFKL